MTTSGLTAPEQAQLISLLQKIAVPVPQLDTPLYVALARLLPQPTIEAVPLCLIQSNQVQVLLLKRGPDAAMYAGYWHFPGAMIRASDENLSTVFGRIAAELGVTTLAPNFVGHLWRPNTARGPILSVIYTIRLDTKRWSGSGQWFDIEELPQPMVEDQSEMIRVAALSFIGTNEE